MVSEYQSSARVTYEDLFDRLNLSNNPGIPTSTALQALDVDLKTLRENARTRHLAADKALRTVLSRLEQQKNRADALEQEKKDEQERRDRIIVTKFKKRKAESDHKRPLAVGAHQPTNQDGKGVLMLIFALPSHKLIFSRKEEEEPWGQGCSSLP